MVWKGSTEISFCGKDQFVIMITCKEMSNQDATEFVDNVAGECLKDGWNSCFNDE